MRATNMMSMSSATNVNDNSNQYVVTRNGKLMPWSQIHKQYKRVDDITSSDEQSSVVNTSTSSDEQSNSTITESDTTPMDASTLLQLLPRGAYTTCRTVKNGTHIYQFDYHVKRLAVSAQSILESITEGETGGEEVDKTEEGKQLISSKSSHPNQHGRTPSIDEIQELKIVDEAWEREMALNCIRSTLEAFTTRYPNNTNDSSRDFRITLLATWENHQQPFQSVLYCHVGILPQSSNSTQTSSSSAQQEPNKHIQVLIHGHGRENALAKDSKWVSDRKSLTSTPTSSSSTTTPQKCEEIILLNDNGELLEGTQTNFYVVKDRTIITANEGILYGSVRDSVLRVCNANDIHVELRPPTLDDLRHASGVFITSTSRLVMPVHEVILGDLMSFGNVSDTQKKEVEEDGNKDDNDALPPSYFYPNCETTENIRQLVLKDVETRSTSVCSN